MADPPYRFGPFRLAPAQRTLFQDDKPVRLGSRALDLLIMLVEHAGEILSHDVLIAHVWPNVHVDEGSLRVHVAALRKVLGGGQAAGRYIINVPGRGYSFVAPVSREHGATLSPPSLPSGGERSGGGNLPVSLSSIVGRADVVASLAAQLRLRRFLTILGPGGIGKTTVAVAVAHSLAGAYRDGVWFVGLAALSDPALVPAAIMSALDQASLGSDAMASLTGFLRDRQALIVLDNCEHLIGAAAAAAVAVLKAAPGVHLLATSREALRAEGEWTQRLPSLAIPASDGIDASEALKFAAVQLFSDRAIASMDEFSLGNDDVATVVEICRQLDGIPLAIELAAARVDVYGLKGLAARLGDHLMLATRGRRTALPRHQTLQAALDWSYDLLPAVEAAILRRLAVFADDFSLDAAVALAGDLTESPIAEAIADLVAKSLVVVDLSRDLPSYRLLVTTRLYAREKLRAAGEYAEAARRHAEYWRQLFERAEADSETLPQSEWLGIYGRYIDDVRAALGWAFSPEGDARLGVALTVTVVPLWVQLSLLSECAELVERALATLGSDATMARARMQLSAALGWALLYGIGRIREAKAAWTTTLALAEELGDRKYRLRALWGLCIDQFNNGEFRSALGFARQFSEVVAESSDPIDRLMADRLLGTTLHYLGDQTEARRHIDEVVANLGMTPQQQIVRFRFDLRVSTHYFRARILWLQGLADQALSQVERNIEEGRALDHALTYCSVLGQAACPIAYLAGDLVAAERYGAMLLDHTERHPIRPWQQWARCFNALLMIKQGDLAGGLAGLRREFDRVGDARFLPRFLLPLGEFAAALGANGEIDEGLALVDETLARCRARDEGWYLAELLRIKGEILVTLGAASHAPAEACFEEALAIAHRQGALFWELRSASSAARLRLAQGHNDAASAVLAPVCERLSEGFQTADFRAAQRLLESLAP